MLDIVKKHLAAFASSNWADFRDTLAEDAVYEEVASLERVVGAAKFVASAQRWKTAFPDFKATIIRGYTVGDRAIVELEWEGTQNGTLEGPFGVVHATGRRGRLNALVMFTIKQGKIVESRNYFDMLTMLNQLGITPAFESSSHTRHPSARI